MKPLDALLQYVPTGTTEGERAILKEAFTMPEQMATILSGPAGSPRILVGNKGVGKTAILEELESAARAQSIPALLIRPDDLNISPIASATDIGTIKRVLYTCLLHAIAVQIGRQLRGLLKGPAANLYDLATETGAREPDLFSKLTDLIAVLAKPVVGIDATKLAQDLGRRKPVPNLGEIIENYLSGQEKIFLLLIDDTDQVASPGTPDHLNRVWGLLLAVRKITQDDPSIRCYVSLRSEVWSRLARNDAGQRDQTDHIRPLIESLRASERYMLEIFNRRIALAAKKLGKASRMDLFFEDGQVILPTSEEKRNWETFLLKSSRERPRDLVQLVGHLARTAKAAGRQVITSHDATIAMRTFSQERAEDLAVEMGEDCPVFLDVIRSFADLDFEVSFEDLRAHVETIPTRFSTKVRGRILKPDTQDDFIRLLEVIFESGLVNARLPDKTQPRGFRHVNFLDDPHLIQLARWSELQAATWEVHPVFRTYILSLKDAQAARGLKNKRKGSRK